MISEEQSAEAILFLKIYADAVVAIKFMHVDIGRVSSASIISRIWSCLGTR